MALLSDADIGLAPVGAPLGIRNNNPGNLRPPGSSSGFQQFGSMDEGVKAADHQLELYGQRGTNTIKDVVSKWAPPSENDTKAYVKAVSDKLGLAPDEPLNMQDPKTRAALRDAMLDHETPGWRKAQAGSQAPKGLSDSDIGLSAKPENAPEHMAGRLAKDFAGLADMAASIPGGIASTVGGAFYGAGRDIQDALQGKISMSEAYRRQRASEEANVREKISNWTTSPVAHVMHALGYEHDYKDSDVGRVQGKLSEWLSHGGDWIEKQSGGKVTTQEVQVIAQDFMNLAPLGFAKFLRGMRAKVPEGELRSGSIKERTASEILDKYTEETGNPEKFTPADIRERMSKDLSTKSDAEIAAEASAYDLMTRGASLKEVMAVRKRNPLVGAKLDEFMAKRRETLGGPLASHIQIDEILGPRREVPTPEGKALPASGAAQPGEPAGMGGNVNPPSPTPPRPALPAPRAQLAGPRNPGGPGPLPPRGQGGAINTKALLTLAGVGAGAYAGAVMSDNEKLEGAILGGSVALTASLLPRAASRVSNGWKKALTVGATTAGLGYGLSKLDQNHPVEGALIGMMWGASRYLPKAKIPQIGLQSIDDLVNLRNGAIESNMRQVNNTSWAMRTAVPDQSRREAVAAAVEAGSPAGLSPQERAVYNAYRGFTAGYGAAAQNAGVLKDLVQNYVTHVVEREALPRTKVQEVIDALFGEGDKARGGGISPKSPFAKSRKYATFQDLERALQGTGLKIKSRDIADLVDIYGKSMVRAVENKKLFDNLKAAKVAQVPNAKAYIEQSEHAPGSYVHVNTPQLQGFRVHPDLAPAIKFIAESHQPGYVMRGILGLSLAQKRLATGLSLFHAQNLVNAYMGASGVRSAMMFKDINAALDAYRKGGLGDVIDTGLKNGLRIERPMETDLHAGKRLGQAIDNLVNGTLGSKFSGFEKGLGGVEALQRETFDKVTWDYLHSGLKLALFIREFEKGMRDHPTWGKDQVAKQVASFVNDTFGGLDWYRVATETQSQLMRNIALNVLSPSGRGALQVLMFAPDWTMSTFRAMYKALPGSGALPLTQRLHQKYVMRTALIWATLMNGYNMAASGHPIWDNKDPTKIEWRDGTTQQIAKHAMEGPEWLLNPRQTALNKLGMPVKEVIDQLTGQEYLTANGKGIPMQESRVAHFAKNVSPLSLQQGEAPGRDLGEVAKRSALSTLGMPVYRMSAKEKAAAKAERERQRKHKTYGSKP